MNQNARWNSEIYYHLCSSVIENTILLFNISVKHDVQPTIIDVVSAQLAKPKDVSYAQDTSRRWEELQSLW